MSECKLNHLKEDVQSKYHSQASFIPEELKPLFHQFFESTPTQPTLNEVFHLLKKYDLASPEEQNDRNDQLYSVLYKAKNHSMEVEKN